MTQEEKAKSYDGLIERLKDLKFAYRFSPLSDTIEDIFPELKEPEDERIRKWLIYYFKEVCDNVSEKEKKGVLAWLENLRPQSTWMPSDEQMSALWDSIKHNLQLHPILESLYNDLKKLKG